MMKFQDALKEIKYPAFVVSYGRSKSYISTHNRSEYAEHFGCDLVRTPEDAARLAEGYYGRDDDLEFYIVENPTQILSIKRGFMNIEYDKLDHEEKI